MKSLLAISLASLYGIALRITFGYLNTILAVMSESFLLIGPIIVGFLTVILFPKDKIKTLSSAFFTPWLTSLVILIITMFFNIEGLICWIMMFPIFAMLSGMGGLIAFYFKNRNNNKPTNVYGLSFIIFLPAIVGLLEGEKTLSKNTLNISRTIEINASPAKVWHAITHIDSIAHKEHHFSLATSMGFPRHLSTALDTLAIGGNRKAIYENGLYFDEKITKFETEKLLALDINTDPNKIPPTVMDEHIIIGGKHLDILEDSYKLEKISETKTRLILSSKFFINTPFNWYASIWAKYLMHDILDGEIKLIEERCE
jgi:hypothetical protein